MNEQPAPDPPGQAPDDHPPSNPPLQQQPQSLPLQDPRELPILPQFALTPSPSPQPQEQPPPNWTQYGQPSWVPPAPGPSEEPRQGLSRNGRVALIVVVVALFLCCGGLGVAALASGGTSSQNTASTQPTATTKPKPKPTTTPTVTQKELEEAYAAIILPDINTMNSDLNTMGSECSAEYITACDTANQKIADDSEQFIQLLESLNAPACIKVPAAELLQAMKDYHAGAELAVSGINQLDATDVSEGTADYDAANALVGKSTDGITSAHCSG